MFAKESDGHLYLCHQIFKFLYFLKSFKKYFCKTQHVLPFANKNQILQVFQKRLQKVILLCAPPVVVGFAPYSNSQYWGSSNSTFHKGYDFSIVFPHDCLANQKGTAFKLLLQNLIPILLLLTNNLQEYSKAITHKGWLIF